MNNVTVFWWYKHGTANPTGIYNYEIQRVSGSNWAVYVDFGVVLNITGYPYAFNRHRYRTVGALRPQ